MNILSPINCNTKSYMYLEAVVGPIIVEYRAVAAATIDFWHFDKVVEPLRRRSPLDPALRALALCEIFQILAASERLTAELADQWQVVNGDVADEPRVLDALWRYCQALAEADSALERGLMDLQVMLLHVIVFAIFAAEQLVAQAATVCIL